MSEKVTTTWRIESGRGLDRISIKMATLNKVKERLIYARRDWPELKFRAVEVTTTITEKILSL